MNKVNEVKHYLYSHKECHEQRAVACCVGDLLVEPVISQTHGVDKDTGAYYLIPCIAPDKNGGYYRKARYHDQQRIVFHKRRVNVLASVKVHIGEKLNGTCRYRKHKHYNIYDKGSLFVDRRPFICLGCIFSSLESITVTVADLHLAHSPTIPFGRGTALQCLYFNVGVIPDNILILRRLICPFSA